MNRDTPDLDKHFPCDFPVKVMGLAEDDFERLVLDIFQKHYPEVNQTAIKSSLSKEAKYLSITITIQAQSKAQLDALYMELTKHPKILMAL